LDTVKQAPVKFSKYRDAMVIHQLMASSISWHRWSHTRHCGPWSCFAVLHQLWSIHRSVSRPVL